MRIGIMLRHFDQHRGGVKNYTNYLLNELFSLNSSHEFVLIYNNSKFAGAYKHFSNVREIAVNISSRLLWDQIGVPLVQKKEKIDIIYNPKYSIPLNVNCPSVFVCHGLDWYLMPWGSKMTDRMIHKFLFPQYTLKATSIIAVSNTTKEHLVEFLNVDKDKIYTIYEGVHESFRTQMDRSELEKVRLEFKLPERFFLFAGQIYPPKNFGRILQAYAKVGPKQGIYLVATGEHRWLCEDELNMIEKLGISHWVKRPGWIDNHALICTYKLAEALLIPSLYESFCTPIAEAMATGCPIITSNRFGTKEIASNAALLVDPESIENIAEAMQKVLIDKKLRGELIKNGYERVRQFRWSKAAAETLIVLEKTKELPTIKGLHFQFFKLKKKNRVLVIKKPERLSFL
jgi:O-antigen biosynthesis alpha-1,2-mannosyltransferase